MRTRALVIEGNGWTTKAIAADTILRGVMGLSERSLPPTWRERAWARKLFGQRYEAMSYVADWRDAVLASPALEVERVNINNLIEYRRARGKIREYPLVIILHSAAGDSMSLLRRTAGWFRGRRGALAVFLGNEYDLLPEKIAFCRDAEADFICSQLPIESARWLYADAGTRVLAMPHALNPALYRPAPGVSRSRDIGFIGDVYGWFIGDVERTSVIRYFADHGAAEGLACDIRTGRVPPAAWIEFLTASRATVGAESGTYFLDRTGELIAEVRRFIERHPAATWPEVSARFFAGRPVEHSGKAISSRHFEPIGTRTCQLLVEGDYNGILRGDEHYIAIRKDLSNVGDVIERFRDEGYRAAMVERTYEFVMANHTYAHRIAALARATGAA